MNGVSAIAEKYGYEIRDKARELRNDFDKADAAVIIRRALNEMITRCATVAETEAESCDGSTTAQCVRDAVLSLRSKF